MHHLKSENSSISTEIRNPDFLTIIRSRASYIWIISSSVLKIY